MQILEPMWLAELLETHVDRGGETDAEDQLERRGLAGAIPFPDLGKLFLLCARGRIRTAAGDPEAGTSDLEECGRWLGALGISNPAIIPWRARAAEALIARGERERARSLAEEELELSRRCGSPTAIGLSLRMFGLAEGDERGVELLREAVASLDAMRPTLELAYARVHLGAALRRAGRRADARDSLGIGQQLAESYEARPLAERARTELAAAGARPRTPLRTGLDALEWAKEVENRGAGEIVLNSIDADGTKQGYELSVTKMISEAVGIPVVASGGAGTPAHLADVLDDATIDSSRGWTCVLASVRDDSELYGLLDRFEDFALHIVSLNELGADVLHPPAVPGGRR